MSARSAIEIEDLVNSSLQGRKNYSVLLGSLQLRLLSLLVLCFLSVWPQFALANPQVFRQQQLTVCSYEKQEVLEARWNHAKKELAAIAEKFGQPVPSQRLTICYAADPMQFGYFLRQYQLNVEEWVAGLTYASGQVIIIKDYESITPNGLTPGITLRHELAHWVLADVGRQRGAALPRWLDEGLSMWAADQTLSRLDYLKIASLSKSEQLKRFKELRHQMSSTHYQVAIEYQQSVAFVQWLEIRLKEYNKTIKDLIVELREPVSLETAFFRALPVGQIESDWRYELAQESSELEYILLSLGVYHWLAFLAIIAFIRYFWKRRKILQKLDKAEAEETPEFDFCQYCSRRIELYLLEEHEDNCPHNDDSALMQFYQAESQELD